MNIHQTNKLKKKNLFLNSYKKLRILVTGTTGFKGAWLAFWLHNLGAKVFGVALKPEKNAILFESLKLNNKIEQHFIDITNFDKVNNIIKKTKPDIIFHLAAQSIVSSSYKDPISTFKTNILGSANVLESYRINKIPYLVYITSDKCYLNLDLKRNYKENDILGGFDNYSSSKASAELIFSSFFRSYFADEKYLKLASARAGNVIGGGDMKLNRIVPDTIKALVKSKNLKLRNPKATRPWQHVLEPLSGYLLLGYKLLNQKLKVSTTPNWNFGPETINCRNVNYITNSIVKNWGNKKLNIEYEKKNNYHEAKLLSLNIEKAKKELNWKPRLKMDETIKLTVDWYKYYFENKNIEKFTENQIEFYLNK